MYVCTYVHGRSGEGRDYCTEPTTESLSFFKTPHPFPRRIRTHGTGVILWLSLSKFDSRAIHQLGYSRTAGLRRRAKKKLLLLPLRRTNLSRCNNFCACPSLSRWSRLADRPGGPGISQSNIAAHRRPTIRAGKSGKGVNRRG